MTILQALILGLVQGLTEFIPVSSSGHLIIGHEIFGVTDGTLVFDVALHIGTLLALIIFFWRDLVGLAVNFFIKNSQGRLARLIAAATLPAAIAGFLASDWIDNNLRNTGVVAISMALVGVVMLLVERYSNKQKELKEATISDGLSMGFAQALALVPGVSRSGATITVGMLRGLSRSHAARLSFLMAVPITLGAIVGSLLGAESGMLRGQTTIFAVGIAASLLSGLVAIRFLLKFLSSHSLKAFAYYRIALAAIVLLFLV